MRHDLVSVADPEDGHASLVSVADQGRLGRDGVGDVGPVHAPLTPQRQHEFVPLQRLPIGGVLPVTFREGVSVLPKAIGDEAAIGINNIGHQQGAHTPNGTRRVQVAMKTFFNSV